MPSRLAPEVVSVAFAALTLVACSGSAARQDGIPADRSAAAIATQCYRTVTQSRSRPLPSGSAVELLVAAGANVPARQWRRYESIATEVVASACVSSAALEIRPITATSLSEPPVFSGTAPSPDRASDLNPLLLSGPQLRFVSASLHAVSRLHELPASQRSDPIGAIKAASVALARSRSANKFIVVDHHNWQQAPPKDLYAYRDDPRRHLKPFLAALRASGEMPDLRGITVVFTGVATGAKEMNASDIQLAQLCDFWREVVTTAGGTFGDCSAELPSSLRV